MLIIIEISLMSYGESINECKVDIYFGNGVWNTIKKADISRQELDNIIEDEIIKGDPILAAKYGEVKLQYNRGDSWDIDLVETFYQLKNAGQISEWTFFTLMDELLTKRAADIIGEDLKTMRNKLLAAITLNEQKNVTKMLEKYYNESFQYSHRVLLVSHSQGNLFANRVYDNINPTEYQDYFANVQVASPASSVHAKKGMYVTGIVDPIINPIPGSMGYNAVLDLPGGHAFVGAYLSSLDAYGRILDGIKNKLAELDNIKKTPSQWTTDQEFSKDTCDYRITVKHRFDPSIEMAEKVYPFNAAKKLYRAKNKAGAYEYVKATCGGTHILDEWNGKKDDECWMINNPPKEKISAGQRFTRDDTYDIVTDNLYHLQWKDDKEEEVMSFYAARNYCSNLDYAEHTDWRLPFIAELENLVFYDTAQGISRISDKFKHLHKRTYWAANVYNDPTSAYDKAAAYNFNNLQRTEYDVRVSMNVVCVRDEN